MPHRPPLPGMPLAPLAMLSSHAAYCQTHFHTLSETKLLPVFCIANDACNEVHAELSHE